MNTWWFLLNMQFYKFSINLKGTKCLPWLFACHGLPDNVNSGSFPTPVWGNYSFHGRVRKAEKQRASMSCSKLPVLIVIDYVLVHNWVFIKAKENELKSFTKGNQLLIFLLSTRKFCSSWFQAFHIYFHCPRTVRAVDYHQTGDIWM